MRCRKWDADLSTHRDHSRVPLHVCPCGQGEEVSCLEVDKISGDLLFLI